MVSMFDRQTYTSEFDSHWVPHSCDLVLHVSKESLVNYNFRQVVYMNRGSDGHNLYEKLIKKQFLSTQDQFIL